MSLTNSSYFIKNGNAYSCGINDSGQLGLGNTTSYNTPQLITSLSNVKQISCGSSYSLFLLNDGSVYSCGDNQYGQLGLGNTTTTYNIPTLITSLSNVKQISCGYYHSLFLLNDGSVYSCGSNGNGQLGLGNTTTTYNIPTLISSLSNVKQISCGANYTLFLLNDGSVYSCGSNGDGQLGIGNTTTYAAPQLISSLSNVKQISCGSSYSLFILNNDSVYSCGSNNHGELGIGNTTEYHIPTLIPSLSNVKQITCGGNHSLFLLNDGSVYSCGLGNFGQLGLGDSSNRYTPQLITSLSNVKQISCGYYHSLFLLDDGSAYSCGDGNSGRLGLGDSSNRSTPTLIPSLSDINYLQDIINNLIIKLLIQDGNNIEIPQDNNLLKIGSLPYTLNLFNTYGMNDLSNINETVISKINNNKYNIGLLRKND